MPFSDKDELLKQLDMILAPMPANERELMKAWAGRELVEKPIIMMMTARLWVPEYEKDGQKHPAGVRSVEWRIGNPSPQNPDALIFAMVPVGEPAEVHVFSFAPVPVEEGSEEMTVVWFHETIFHPDTIFGPITGEALFEEFARLLLDEDEHEDFMSKREAFIERALREQRAAARPTNGGPS